jgi:predicted 3-demethylubiquinone-9 3-methyltransferase (glyoxalase superfamily)
MSATTNRSRVTPFLWFDNDAEAAAAFYTKLIPNSRVLDTMRSSADTPSGKAGTVIVVTFELDGQRVTAMNGGPGHPHTDAFSFSLECDDQAEIDRLWSALTAEGGSEVACGWLKDRFGLSWQIVPRNIGKLLSAPGAMQAMMKMKKLVIADLERAGKA